MSAPIHQADDRRLHAIQQSVKWIVYTLLIINFGFYVIEDIRRAAYTLHAGSTFLNWTSAFATTIDESAWFLLLAMFEIETYVLDDEQWKGWVARLVRGARIVCFILIAHTVYAWAIAVNDLRPTVVVENAGSLCELADTGLSYVYNLEYTDITSENCTEISAADTFYSVGKEPVVSDFDGLELERDLALADLAEAALWLLVLLAIEFVVRLQSRGVTGGARFQIAKYSKLLIYAMLLGIGIYWANLGHWLYLWDEIVWIGGFAAIEMNLNQWRDELQAEPATT